MKGQLRGAPAVERLVETVNRAGGAVAGGGLRRVGLPQASWPSVARAAAALGLLLSCVFALFTAMTDVPAAAVVAADVLAVGFLAAQFERPRRRLLLLHPPIVLISSRLYESSFLLAGDGSAYEAVVRYYFDPVSQAIRTNALLAYWMSSGDVLAVLRHASLGVAPVFVIPEYFFGVPQPEVYYLWQATLHVLLTTVVVVYARATSALSESRLFAATAFAVLGPSFFDLGSAPTRHVVTFFGVFALFVSYVACARVLTMLRSVALGCAVVVVMISKAPLIIPFVVFVIVDQFILARRERLRGRVVVLVVLSILGVVAGPAFYETAAKYSQTARGGGATLSAAVEWPVIGWLVKYLYALLSPFPWSDGAFFTATIYSGNWFLFGMHVASSLCGLYLFLHIGLRFRRIVGRANEATRMVMFGVIMSLSILRGFTGFHTYLLIYFPFLMPVLEERREWINPLLPLGVVAVVEIFVHWSR